MRTLQRVGAGLFALTLFAGLAACGDDDESDEGTEATDGAEDGGEQAASNDEFCGAVVDFNSAVLEVELDESSTEADIKAAGDELAPLSDTMASDAPDDLSDTADELNATVQSLLEGDAEAFNADATFETYTEFLGGAVETCEFDAVDVDAVDYAFEGVPETIDAGTVAFKLTNSTEHDEEHEMVIFSKADGVTESFEDLLALPEEEVGSKVVFAGAAFAPPGGEGFALAELGPGEYAMVCFIPVGGADDGPPHFTQGMLQEFAVE